MDKASLEDSRRGAEPLALSGLCPGVAQASDYLVVDKEFKTTSYNLRQAADRHSFGQRHLLEQKKRQLVRGNGT